MFFPMQLLCFYNQPPALFASLSRQLLVHGDDKIKSIFKDRRLNITNPYSSYTSCRTIHALKEDSKQYEIDPEKAKEALKELDQQIQSVSNKQVSSPKVTVSDVKVTRDQVNDNGKLEISGSFLATLAAGLVLFTIFYNVLFYTVIKPSIDGGAS